MRKSKTQKVVLLSMLASIAFVLMFFVIPMPFLSFLKLDFSDIPILVGTFMYGMGGGVVVAFVRSLLHFIITGGDLVNLIGDTASFFASLAFVLPIYLFYKKEKNVKGLLKGAIAGTLSLTVVMSLANYFVLTPIYIKVLGFDYGMPIQKMVLFGILPFNLIKGVSVSVVFMLVQGKLLGWLNSKMHVKEVPKETTIKK